MTFLSLEPNVMRANMERDMKRLKNELEEYVEESLYYSTIQCSEICTLRNEKFHTET